MAYIPDLPPVSFTITLSAFLEGIGTINYIQVISSDGSFDWSGGTWTPSLPTAKEDDVVSVYVDIQNTGAADDTIWGGFISPEVDPNEGTLDATYGWIQEGFTIQNALFSPTWTFTMPGNNVDVTINAGHVVAEI